VSPSNLPAAQDGSGRRTSGEEHIGNRFCARFTGVEVVEERPKLSGASMQCRCAAVACCVTAGTLRRARMMGFFPSQSESGRLSTPRGTDRRPGASSGSLAGIGRANSHGEDCRSRTRWRQLGGGIDDVLRRSEMVQSRHRPWDQETLLDSHKLSRPHAHAGTPAVFWNNGSNTRRSSRNGFCEVSRTY